MKELIATVLAVPFIIVSTWFGISAVNHHFNAADNESQQRIAQELRDERLDRDRLLYDCHTKGTKLADGNCLLTSKK